MGILRPGGIIQSISVGNFNVDGRADIAVGTGSGPDDVVLFTANAGWRRSDF